MIWIVLATFLFYSLNITGFKVKNFILTESCIKQEPQDIPFWLIYAGSVVVFILEPNIGKWMLFGFFIIGTITMFFTTVRYMIFPNEKKIKGYNQYFAKTHRIIKPSEKRLIPDTFHIFLLILIPINLFVLIVYIIYM